MFLPRSGKISNVMIHSLTNRVTVRMGTRIYKQEFGTHMLDYYLSSI